MARPMQLIGAGSPKEDIVARLMRVVLLIGLAAAWRPDAAVAQYSWSNFSASVGFGTGSARLGVGASYTALDPLYDFYFEDPCWDYAYYEWYRHTCHRGYDRIHLRHNYSVVSVNPYRRPHRRSYYWPYGYSSYSHFSLSFGLNFGYGYPSSYYGSHYYTPFYPIYGYPTYGYAAYGHSPYGYPGLRLPRLWCRTVWEEQNGICDDPPRTCLSRLAARALLPAVQGVSAGWRATYRDRPLDHVRKNDSHTDHHGPEGQSQGLKRAE